MAVDSVRVNTGRMSNTVSEMGSDVASIRSYANQIYQDIRELDAMWDGTANQAFNIQFQKDQEELGNICDEIEKFIDRVEYAKNEYNKCENTVADIVNSIRV